MRLINTKTRSLEEFFGTSIPNYAILSHRWEDEEVLFQDMHLPNRTSKQGWVKIQGCCKQAAADGWKYAWVDSCCIDKTSSAELSEAINSMFKWYANASVCYVYLSDVSVASLPTAKMPEAAKSFRESSWFTRGWTLQELLAPRHVIFYDEYWNDIGTRRSLQSVLREITSVRSIDEDETYRLASVAQKLSWAAQRQTTREEDIAYSLMGLLDINMPILYGEGKQAFIRLQEEILKTSADESIFAWNTDESDSRRLTGLLASSPACFRKCGNIISRSLPRSLTLGREPYTMTNRGLRMEHLILWTKSEYEKYCKLWPFRVILGCAKEGQTSEPGSLSYLTISIMEEREGFYAHRVSGPLTSVDINVDKPQEITIKTLFVGENVQTWSSKTHQRRYFGNLCPWSISFQSLINHEYELCQEWHKYLGDEAIRVQPSSSSHRLQRMCDTVLFFKHRAALHINFAVILYWFSKRSARIVEMTSQDVSVDVSAVESLLEQFVEMGDRISKRMAGGEVVSVNVNPGCIDNQEHWLADITIHPTVTKHSLQ
jgi:hypothetical protein